MLIKRELILMTSVKEVESFHWDYWILSQKSRNETIYSMLRVDYNRFGKPISYVKIPVCVINEDLEDMIEDIQMMLEAFEQEVISMEYLDENL